MTDMPQTRQSSLLTANLICMGSMLIWAAGLPAADHLIPLLIPEQLNALRMLLAGGFLVVVWALFEGFGPLRRTNWLKGIAVGSLIGLGAWFLIKGQAIGGAVTAAVWQEGIAACQFHPEKSSGAGAAMLRRWLAWVERG
jgi:drug/metabolite transporter (DMT)-like permease